MHAYRQVTHGVDSRSQLSNGIGVKQRIRRLRNVQRGQNKMRKVAAWQRAAVGVGWPCGSSRGYPADRACLRRYSTDSELLWMSKRLRVILRDALAAIPQFWVKAYFMLQYLWQDLLSFAHLQLSNYR